MHFDGLTFAEAARKLDLLQPSRIRPKGAVKPTNGAHKAEPPIPNRPPEAVYPYPDELGIVQYSIHRWEATSLNAEKVIRPQVAGRSDYSLPKEVKRYLYRLPDLIAAVAAKKVIFLVEGEKCVEILISLGHCATCHFGGAGNWNKDFAKYFVGAIVIIIRDRDERGYTWANEAFEDISKVALSVKIVDITCPGSMNDKFDIEQHLKAGFNLDQLVTVKEKTRSIKRKSWDECEAQPKPKWLLNDCLGEGDLAMIFGASGSGKSFLVLEMIYCLIGNTYAFANRFSPTKECTVVYAAGEKQGRLGSRLAALRVHRSVTDEERARLGIYHEVPQLYSKDLDVYVDEYIQELRIDYPQGFDVLVIDTKHTATLGADENDSGDAGVEISAAKRIIKQLGCAVILVHHKGRSGENPRGSSAWDGACDLMLEVAHDKDNNRRYLRCAKAGEARGDWEIDFDLIQIPGMDSLGVSWKATAAEAEAEKTTREQILAVLRESRGVRMLVADICERINGNPLPDGKFKNAVGTALSRLVKEGSHGIKSDKARGSKDESKRVPLLYWAVEEEDPFADD